MRFVVSAPMNMRQMGSTKLDDLNDVLGTEIESEDYDSIGGHMIELLDHLPKEGETVKEGNYLYSIKKWIKTGWKLFI